METNVNITHSFFSFLPGLFKENGMEKEIRHIPKYEHFLRLIISEQTETDEFVSISNRELLRVIRQAMITRIKGNLISLGVINCDFHKRFDVVNGRTIGKESYGYRITSEYYDLIKSNNNIASNGSGFINANQPSTTPHKISAYYNGSGFDKRLEKARIKFNEKVQKKLRTRWDLLVDTLQLPEYSFIKHNALKVEVNSISYSWIDEQERIGRALKDSLGEFVNERGHVVVYRKKERILTELIGNKWKHHLRKIENKCFKFNCPVSVNRVFYNITSMPGDLRRFLMYKDKELIYLDYSNFQPLLFIKQLQSVYATLPDDVSKYIELASKGKFYDYIKKVITSEGYEITDEVNFKIDFFSRVFFSSEKRKYKYRLAFDKYFPSVSKVITQMKLQNYKDLSISLQRLESEVVINGVFRSLATNYPNSFALPVHDAILCEPPMQEIIHQLMVQHVEQLIGVPPTVKVINLITQL